MQDTPKRLKRLVREWTAVAHDREVSKTLLDLRAHFDAWQLGEITAADLNDLIHQFHQRASREIWKKYATNHLEPAIGLAVATGILRQEELPPELLQQINYDGDNHEHGEPKRDDDERQRSGSIDVRSKDDELQWCRRS